MHILQKHIDFVNEQVKHYDRMSVKSRATPEKQAKYISVSKELRELLKDIVSTINNESLQSKGATQSDAVVTPVASTDKPINSKLPPNFFSNPLALSPADYAGLEDDLLKELNITESDKIESTIVELINAAGGTLILDKIIVGLYHLTGEKHQRIPLTARLYRMSKKNLVFSVPKKKGIYTTIPISNEDQFANDEDLLGDSLV